MGFRNEWPLMCCICFTGLTPETCAVDADDVKWDVCKGQCARDSGLYEKRLSDCFNCGDCHDCAYCDPEYYA